MALMKNMSREDWGVIVLAAGRGTRMGDGSQKVLKPLAGKPIICWVLDTLGDLKLVPIVLVLGYLADQVIQATKVYEYTPVLQEELLGTGHALMTGLGKLPAGIQNVLVLFGDDAGLYRTKTLEGLLIKHEGSGAMSTLLTTSFDKPRKLGGLHKDKEGRIIGVTTMEQMINEGITEHSVLCGAICFNVAWISRVLKEIPRNVDSGEYLLPKFIEIGAAKGEFTQEYKLVDPREWTSVNSLSELEQAELFKIQLLNE